MLLLALTFFAAAVLAAVYGYTTIGGVTLASARVLFFVFLAFALIALMGAALRPTAAIRPFRAKRPCSALARKDGSRC
jgi:uncharacterized membrane protein YtjA (UPF0391 family)